MGSKHGLHRHTLHTRFLCYHSEYLEFVSASILPLFNIFPLWLWMQNNKLTVRYPVVNKRKCLPVFECAILRNVKAIADETVK